AVRMFRTWGLEERVVGGTPTKPSLRFRIDGETRVLALSADDHGDGRFMTQQGLVRNLIDVFVRDGGDLRFGVTAAIETTTRVRCDDEIIECDIVAGCDGEHGISRAAIPREQLTRYAHEYGYAWLTVLAEVPANHQALMAIHERGFAGQFTRGPTASRFYLQCPLDRTRWTDDEIWTELALRFGEPITRGRIVSTQHVPIRSVVTSPMSYRNLYLLGDAAHLIPPMSAKGMNLALHDAETLATCITTNQLETYSATCLRHIWSYQAFAAWFTDMIHDAGDPSHHGEFRRQVARADFERLFTSASANRLFSELIAGLN
ncbi:MAG TPA: FAD-dependent monooxygenase, partial [Kofleriaceae bacterium]